MRFASPRKNASPRLCAARRRWKATGRRYGAGTSSIPAFPDVLESLGAANREFDAANYAAAAAGLDRAIALMDTLTNSKPARYEDALAAGRQALADENAERAEAAFRVAVALNPTDPVAEIGLARARSLPEVLERMREGRNREAAGDVDAAHTAYRHAATLDPAHEAAVAAAARTEGIIADRDYRNAVTMALKAIDGRRFGQAAAAISAARRLRPDAPEVRDLAARLQQERQFASISALRGRAEAAERSEDWAAAAERYGEILAIDPSVSVAVTGRKRALDMRDLHARIDIYLDDPDRLSSDAPLERAGRVLAAANGISSAGVRLREKTARLEVLIASASRPRDVVLRSDGETAVTVYRVARFRQADPASVVFAARQIHGRRHAAGVSRRADRIPGAVLRRRNDGRRSVHRKDLSTVVRIFDGLAERDIRPDEFPLALGVAARGGLLLGEAAETAVSVWLRSHDGRLYVQPEPGGHAARHNGAPVTDPVWLSPGDTLQIGDVRLSFENGEEGPVLAAPAGETTADPEPAAPAPEAGPMATPVSAPAADTAAAPVGPDDANAQIRRRRISDPGPRHRFRARRIAGDRQRNAAAGNDVDRRHHPGHPPRRQISRAAGTL